MSSMSEVTNNGRPHEAEAVDPLERYSRQTRFHALGMAGQRKLMRSRVTICGCGALGTVLANHLARAGVGFLRIVDRDFIETHNLQRQILFDEADVASNLPKAEAAARKVRAINSTIEVEPIVTDIDHTNILDLTADVDLILDGTDNFETRYLINDAAVKLGKPWIYGGVIGSEGQTMTILPGETPCLRCVVETAPPPGMAPTCETAGVLGPAVSVVASFEAIEAIKLLAGQFEALNRNLILIDVWDWTWRALKIAKLREKVNCPCCKGRQFDWLDGKEGSHTTTLCGRNAVQVAHRRPEPIDFAELSRNLGPAAQARFNNFMLRFQADGHEFTVFPDGRAIIKGTNDIAKAKTLYAQYLGN
ncbi:UBA/THIF-type NAD/FAD binding protein [Isosphaera pallida ATCC 43644]|uniref:UBA/THIF-type NAD/FAD binding protein n=2 Tax=Isosphaera pallida TaxID=128 RepID=E8QXC0_ISOPI|nr:UBA/THIF-type NAD/FAD binding protein [Isosphaera pallida ATCC 43644]